MTQRATKAHVNADALSRHPCLGENCKFCSRHEDKDQLADPSHKILVPPSWVAGQVLPLNTDEEFGTLAWSTAQREDHALGPVYKWVRAGKDPVGRNLPTTEHGQRVTGLCGGPQNCKITSCITSGWKFPLKELPG